MLGGLNRSARAQWVLKLRYGVVPGEYVVVDRLCTVPSGDDVVVVVVVCEEDGGVTTGGGGVVGVLYSVVVVVSRVAVGPHAAHAPIAMAAAADMSVSDLRCCI
jgi:hypothetical protein